MKSISRISEYMNILQSTIGVCAEWAPCNTYAWTWRYMNERRPILYSNPVHFALLCRFRTLRHIFFKERTSPCTIRSLNNAKRPPDLTNFQFGWPHRPQEYQRVQQINPPALIFLFIGDLSTLIQLRSQYWKCHYCNPEMQQQTVLH